jgi:photosystem II stability/assembly factor-like uncharacterized protein
LLFAQGYPLRADRVRFLALTGNQSGALLAVGERGVVARRASADAPWELQRLSTRESLTAAGLRDDGFAIAVGHGGVAFRSQDAGKTWEPMGAALETINLNRDPWLGVALGRRGGAWLLGGFGLLAHSDDEGKTWQRISPLEPEFDRHLYGLTEVLEGGYLLVGESGSMAESFNGRDWKALRSPYDGSWFGGLQTTAGSLLAFGMRGQIFRRAAGQSAWAATQGAQAAHAWVAAAQLRDGAVVLVGGQGIVAVSRDDGRNFSLQTVWEGSLSGIAQDAREQIWLAGTQGLKGFDAQWKPLA